MLTSVTRDQSSRRRAQKATSSQTQSALAHGSQSKRVVLQRYDSHPLSGRCCSILSAIRTATRCSSEFNSTCHQTGAHSLQLKHAVLGPSRQTTISASSHPPGSARLSVPTRGFNHVAFTTAFTAAADWPSWPSRMRHRVLWCVAVSKGSSRQSVFLCRGVSSSDHSSCCPY